MSSRVSKRDIKPATIDVHSSERIERVGKKKGGEMKVTEGVPINNVNNVSDCASQSSWSWQTSNPKKNLWVFVLQFVFIHTMIFAVLGAGLYNISVSDRGREIWVGLVSWTIGVIVPSPSSLKTNKISQPFEGAINARRSDVST